LILYTDAPFGNGIKAGDWL